MQDPIYDARLDEMDIAVFDLETTGRVPSNDRIIQVAIIPVSEAAIAGEGWSQLVNPGNDHLPLDDVIVDLTGIETADLEGQPGMNIVLQEFGNRVGRNVVAGHNVRSFDLPFIRRAERRHNIEVQSDFYVDTLVLVRKLHPDLPSKKLGDVARFYGIDVDEDDLHDALVDTRVCAQVLLNQIAELAQQGVFTFSDMLDYLS